MRSAADEARKGPIRRVFGAPGLKLREIREKESESTPRTLTGHAAVFDQLSEVIGHWAPFREKIQPGAFAKSLKTRDVVALWHHLSWAPLARVSNGRLILREDGIGLACEITPGASEWGRSAVACVDDGTVKHMSFGFNVVTDFWQTVDQEEIRTIVEADLIEVSPVTFPAYTQTDINARALIAGVDVRELIAAYDSCRAGHSTAGERELLRRVERDLAAAAGPTPDEVKRKLAIDYEYQSRLLDLAAA